MSWLVAVDPGIDATGVATFDLAEAYDRSVWRAGEGFARVMARLGPTTVVRTKPSEDLVERLAAIGNGFGEFAEQCGYGSRISVILIERPAMPGSYAGRRGRQRTKGMINGAAMEKMYLALGVLLDCALCHSELATDGRVELVPAPRMKKELRQRAVVAELHRQRHSLVAQGAKRLSPDMLDAIYLGAAWLSDARRLADVPDDEAVHTEQDSAPASTGGQR